MAEWSFGKIAFGGDWYPEQYDTETALRDLELFREARIDLLTINVFAWTLVQPEEDRYDFAYLDWIVSLLEDAGMKACLGTGTAAHPAWMASRYPDILRSDFQGRRRRFGDRHNSCPSSPAYRRFAPRLAGALAEHFEGEETIALWHVSNELMGACYCDNCRNEFRAWLQQRYGDLDTLNAAWNTRFWNQYVTDWDQIELPNALTVQWGDRNTAMPAMSLDYNRFNSDNILGMFLSERDAIRRHIPDAVITTNFMGPYRPIDYGSWGPHLDIVSWDNYPSRNTPASETAFSHALMRGLRPDGRFLLMEQTPSQTNWQPYNSLKRPGVMRLQSLQAVAHGSDSVLFFQMRRARGGCEKFHGAVVEHSGRTDTRVFQEVAALGRELERLGGAVEGSRVRSEVALWFDWSSWWAVENSMGPNKDLYYLDVMRRYYAAFHKLGVPVDVVGPGAGLGEYGLLVAPLLYLVEDSTEAAVRSFVESGGTLVTGVLGGVADSSDRVFPGGAPGPFKDLLGLWSEEVDALPPDEPNELIVETGWSGRYACRLLFDLVRVESAEVLGVYGTDFYANRPALTRNRYGNGTAFYVATLPDEGFVDALAVELCHEAGIDSLVPNLPTGVEVTRRTDSTGREIYFVLNHGDEPAVVPLGGLRLEPLPAGEAVRDRIEVGARDVFIGRTMPG